MTNAQKLAIINKFLIDNGRKPIDKFQKSRHEDMLNEILKLIKQKPGN